MPLSDVKVKNAKAGPRPVKLADGHGMYLLVTPAGGKCWRLKYRWEGKEKTLALGTYPVVTLLDARQKTIEAKKLLAIDVDPGLDKKLKKVTATTAAATAAGNTFEIVAKEWHGEFKSTWDPEHADRLLARMNNYLIPYLGPRPIAEIEAPEILACLKRAQQTSLEVALRVRILTGQIWRYAVATGRVKYNPVPDLRGAIPPPEENHYAAPTDPKAVGQIIRMLDGYDGQFTTLCALQLAPLTFVRPGELRAGEWSEVDFETAAWNIPGPRMKEDVAHLVPLSTHSLEILRKLHALTGHGKYMFPSIRSAQRCMSENTVNAALRCLGIGAEELTGHGFRATARTILAEVLGYRPDVVDHQLAHAVKDPNGCAYNRTAFLDYRRFMMQDWSSYLDLLKTSGDPKTAAAAILSHASDRPLPLY